MIRCIYLILSCSVLLLLSCRKDYNRQGYVYTFPEDQTNKFPAEYLAGDTITVIYSDPSVVDSFIIKSNSAEKYLISGKHSFESGVWNYYENLRTEFVKQDEAHFMELRFSEWDEDDQNGMPTGWFLLNLDKLQIKIPLPDIKGVTADQTFKTKNLYNGDSVYFYYNIVFGIRKIEILNTNKSWTFIK